MNYKEREMEKYKDWEREMEEVGFGVYVLVGDHVWRKELSDRFKGVLGSRPVVVNSGLKQMTDKMRYGTMSRKKHFVIFEGKKGKFKKEELDVLGEYLMNPSEHAVMVIYAEDRQERNFLLERFKMLKKANYVKFFDMSYVSGVFKEMFVLDRLNRTGIRCSSSKVRKDMVKNLSLALEELDDNLLTIESLGSEEVTKEDLKENLETYSDYTMTKLLDSLVKVDRKKVPYEVVEEVLGQGMTAHSVLLIIRSHFRLVYQAKLLKVKGIMREKDIVEEKKDLFDREGLYLGDKNIWDISGFRRNRILEDSDHISVRELVYCLTLLDRVLVDSGAGSKKYAKVDGVGLYYSVISIMDRRK